MKHLQVQSHPQRHNKLKQGKLESSSFYVLRQVVDKMQPSNTIAYVYEYDYNKIMEMGLKKHFQYYRYLFEQRKISELGGGKNFHYIKNVSNIENNFKRVFISPFQSRLNSYIEKNIKFNEKESMIILQQIIQAVYSVIKDSYSCYNIRAQNFVKVPQSDPQIDRKLSRFKLETVPFGYYVNHEQNQSIDSPFIWKTAYQPPQAYLRDLTQQQLFESIVWNIGCLWVHLLSGKHALNNQETIKRFSIGNGTDGVFNFKILGLDDNCLSTSNKQLLIKMLQYKPQLRLSSKKLFEHSFFGRNIIEINLKQESELDQLISINKSTILRQSINILKSNGIYDQFLQQQTKFDYNHKILSMDEFLTDLVQIIRKKDLPVTKQQKASIQTIISRSNNRLKLKQKPTQLAIFSPKKNPTKNSINQISREGYMAQQFNLSRIEHFLKPYKFYLDKSIFLSHCTSKIAIKLTQILYPKSRDSIKIPNFKQIAKQGYEKIFVFRFGMYFMRLIYLQTILQNLKLHQNVFTIPECTQNIKNVEFDNTNSEWLLFSSTAIYEALILFINEKLKNCEHQFEALIEKQGEQQDKQLSERCLKSVQKYLNMKYKICSIQRFLPYYQMHVKSAINIVDEYDELHNGYRCNLTKPGSIPELQNMRNIGYLVHALFIESQNIYHQEYHYQLFQRFMSQNDSNKQEFISSKDDSLIQFSQLVSRQSVINNKDRLSFTPIVSNEIFSFLNYEKFLRWGPLDPVAQHVSYFISRLSF